MKILILAHANDLFAHYVADTIKRCFSPEAIRLILAEDLVYAVHWMHEINNETINTRIDFADGSCWETGDTGVIFNRLKNCSVPLFSHAEIDDRNYAMMETTALWLSWLKSFTCPIVNPIQPASFGNSPRSDLQWAALINKVGLPMINFVFTTDPRHLQRTRITEKSDNVASLPNWFNNNDSQLLLNSQPVMLQEPLDLDSLRKFWIVGDEIVGLDVDISHSGLQRLRKYSNCDLLELTLVTSKVSHDWKILDVNTFPHHADVRAIDAIGNYLAMIASERLEKS